MSSVERSVSSRFPDMPILPLVAPGRAHRIDLEPDVATLTVKGRPELVNALVAEELRLFVDLSELDDAKPAGELPVRAVLPNGVALVRTEPATVEIRPKE